MTRTVPRSTRSSPARIPLAPLTLAMATALPACTATTVYDAESLHSKGSFQLAADALAPAMVDEDQDGGPDGIEGHNTLWAYLEYGKIQQDAGNFNASADAFDAANRLFEQLDEAANFSVAAAGNNTGAILTDERNRDYLGALHDVTATNTAQTVNMLMLNRDDQATAYARRIIDHEDTSQRIAKRVEAQREAFYAELEASRSPEDDTNNGHTASAQPPDTAAHNSDPLASAFEEPTLRGRLEALDAFADAATPDGANPYAFFVGAVAMLARGNTGEARDFIQRLHATHPNAASLLLPLADERSLGDRVVVLFENGRAPVREDGSIGVNGLNAVPLPRLKFRTASRAHALRIDTAITHARTTTLTSIDALAAHDFRERLFEIWGRPIISQTIKVASSATAYALTRNDDSTIDELIALGGAIWVASAEPDLRSWRTLPGEQAATIIQRPADNTITLELVNPDGIATASRTVTLSDRPGHAILFVRSTASDNLIVHIDRNNQPPAVPTALATNDQ